VRDPLPPESLADATVLPRGRGPLRTQDEGHLVAYREADDETIRSVPLGFGRQTWIPPLSVRIARTLPGTRSEPGTPGGTVPKDAQDPGKPALFQFLAPEGGVQLIPLADLADERTRRLLDRRFVLVGVDLPEDRRHTPFSAEEIPGVMIHAYAAEALLSGSRIRRTPWWVSVLGLLYPCLSLAGRAARGDRARSLVLSAVGVSALFVGIAALAMVVSLLWISALEPLVGLWLFVPLVLLVRRRASPPPATARLELAPP
jgi:hypothetical protein